MLRSATRSGLLKSSIHPSFGVGVLHRRQQLPILQQSRRALIIPCDSAFLGIITVAPLTGVLSGALTSHLYQKVQAKALPTNKHESTETESDIPWACGFIFGSLGFLGGCYFFSDIRLNECLAGFSHVQQILQEEYTMASEFKELEAAKATKTNELTEHDTRAYYLKQEIAEGLLQPAVQNLTLAVLSATPFSVLIPSSSSSETEQSQKTELFLKIQELKELEESHSREHCLAELQSIEKALALKLEQLQSTICTRYRRLIDDGALINLRYGHDDILGRASSDYIKLLHQTNNMLKKVKEMKAMPSQYGIRNSTFDVEFHERSLLKHQTALTSLVRLVKLKPVE